MNDFRVNYDKILEVLQTITKKESFLIQIREPKLKDIELIAMNLTAEYLGINSECQLFRVLAYDLKNKDRTFSLQPEKAKIICFY